jgi:hypothetical protein
MTFKTTLPNGTKIATATKRRYILVDTRDGEVYKRTDTLAVLKRDNRRFTRPTLIIDTETGTMI